MYTKLFFLFLKNSLMVQTAYPRTFWIAVFTKMIRMVIPFVFFEAIFSAVPLVVGWDKKEIFVLLSTYVTLENIAMVTFHRNLAYYFPAMLRQGNFDFPLTQPVNILFFFSFRRVDVLDIISGSIIIFCVWGYAFSIFDLRVSLARVLLFFFACLLAEAFLFALILLTVSISFWTILATGFGRFFEGVMRGMRYPTDIFSGRWHDIFFFFVPLAFFATLPAGILLEKISLSYFLYAVIFVSFLFGLAIRFFFFALKHYQSTA